MTKPAPPRVESLTVRNYRALRGVTLDRLTPLTALLGPNGSGKSTVFDVFAFLSECLSDGIRRAWDRAAHVHHRLASLLPLGRRRPRQPRGGSGGTPVLDRRQPTERHPVPARAASRPA